LRGEAVQKDTISREEWRITGITNGGGGLKEKRQPAYRIPE